MLASEGLMFYTRPPCHEENYNVVSTERIASPFWRVTAYSALIDVYWPFVTATDLIKGKARYTYTPK